jgi:hypothetical protein
LLVGRKTGSVAVQKSYCEIQKSENRVANLAEYSKEGYGSRRAVFSMMMMMMMVN